MVRRCLIPVWLGIILLAGMFLMGQNHTAQTNLCDPDPCEGIPNAVPGSCTLIPGGWRPDDFACQCSPGYTWQPVSYTCQGGTSFALPDTGITLCYNNSEAIECPAPGQAFFGQDAQYVTNPMSFIVSPDGLTVTDNVTGLIWQRCSAGLSGSECLEGTGEQRTWADAVTYCKGLDLAGHTDWRLPNEFELQSIVHYGLYDPAIDTTAYPNTLYTTDDYYWSASTYAAQTSEAWYIYYDDGGVRKDEKYNPAYVRCVHGESVARSFTNHGDGTVTDNVTGLMWQHQDDGAPKNWESALAYCEGLSLAGHSDWRLPDIKELRSIVDNTRYNPAIDTTVFFGTKSGCYLSSSTHASYISYAWGVGFKGGRVETCSKTYTDPEMDLAYVRCVR